LYESIVILIKISDPFLDLFISLFYPLSQQTFHDIICTEKSILICIIQIKNLGQKLIRKILIKNNYFLLVNCQFQKLGKTNFFSIFIIPQYILQTISIFFTDISLHHLLIRYVTIMVFIRLFEQNFYIL
jgi:hypothetical protein